MLKVLATLSAIEKTMQQEATALMIAEDIEKLDELEPRLDGLGVLLVLARDASPTAELMRVLKPFESAVSADDLDISGLAAAAAAVPHEDNAAKKLRTE